jgi:site-specific DNA-methyltransferase (adenine-specific)
LKSTVAVWNKTNPPPVGYNNYNGDLEFIVWMRGKGAFYNNDEVFEIKRKCKRYPLVSSKGRLHPTQKPIPLMEELIRLHAPVGGRVIDPFCGSGTTLIAGLNTGRKVVGIEMDEKYCEIAKQRVLQWYEEHN